LRLLLTLRSALLFLLLLSCLLAPFLLLASLWCLRFALCIPLLRLLSFERLLFLLLSRLTFLQLLLSCF
jgi:hypothetical protein